MILPLKALRINAGLTRSAAAEALSAELERTISPRVLGDSIECRGTKQHDIICAIAKVYGCTVEEAATAARKVVPGPANPEAMAMVKEGIEQAERGEYICTKKNRGKNERHYYN